MHILTKLLLYITIMRDKQKKDGEPGYLHFRVLADYIRSAIKQGEVTWVELRLSGEASLCQLELECLAFGEMRGYNFEIWMRPALEAKLKLAEGKRLNAEEGDNIVELFPDAEAA